MRDELLAIERFDTLLEAQVLVAGWRLEYNTTSRLRRGMLLPAQFAEHWRTEPQPQLS